MPSRRAQISPIARRWLFVEPSAGVRGAVDEELHRFGFLARPFTVFQTLSLTRENAAKR